MTSLIPDLAPVAWALLALAAVLVGVSKTALPGINTLSIAVFAAILPAKASTGALLLLLIVGDVFALLSYRRHADWATLVRLIPAVVAGVVAGALFLAFADDGWVRRVIGVILLLIIAFTLWQRRRTVSAGGPGSGRAARIGYGSLGGFTTMVANAGGPVMSMYFIAARFPVKAFLGTAAWFFAVINLAKVPVSVGLGLITPSTLLLDLVLVPGVFAGAFVGRWIALRIEQRTFEWAVVACTVLGAVYLLVG
ncbi:sulfite exporter TauE/SafE family protein [Leucobacter triazinivorans]|uniref:Probable membrane transporter protein n=1 Tax=Leucobacter triazinivorans TaxID=1784719 RepID=A0A4P6KF26_9MICO|nr:sulfite exporter TauE/SafE family protein [Leucobacter triazinivorans]QBE48997.1 sulfite exporter TauE/SafE family protein [Leucobacter triazinivorans]